MINSLGISNLTDLTEETVGNLVARINDQYGSWLGFKSKKEAVEFLTPEIFGWGPTSDSAATIPAVPMISKMIKETFNRCANKVSSVDTISVHLFPSYNKFINQKMDGVSGYTPDRKHMILFISKQNGWKQALAQTLAHEFAHTQNFSHHRWRTLLDSIIFEGLAEHFRESAVSGKKSPWVKSINQSAAKKYFFQIKNKLSSNGNKIYRELFLGQGNKYPLWTGYAIGYQIIKSYLKNNPKKSWPQIFATKPKEILARSDY